MVWDKTLPNGDADIAVGDDAIRSNNDALETAFGTVVSGEPSTNGYRGEHFFRTGGNADEQSGVHALKQYATRGAAAAHLPLPPGWLCFVKERSVDGPQVENWALGYSPGTGVIYPLDVDQPNIPRTNEGSRYTVAQWSDWETVTPVGTDLTLDASTNPAKRVTINSQIEIQTITLPAGVNAVDQTTTLYLLIEQTGGPYTVSFAAASFEAMGGLPPVVDQTTLLTFTLLPSGRWAVGSAPSLAVIA